MAEKISQETAFETVETVETVETIETIETSIDINGLSSETKNEILVHTKEHRENINRIIVPRYIAIDDQFVKDDNYAVTYSEKDSSFLAWTIDINKNGQQQPVVYFKLDEPDKNYIILEFVLYKKTLMFSYRRNVSEDKCKYYLI